MNLKWTAWIGLGLLVFGSTGGLAYTGWREAVVAGSANETITGRGANLAICERLSDDLPMGGLSPLYCEGSGLGAQFSDIGCSVDLVPAATIPPMMFGNGEPDNDATAGNGFASGGASTTRCLDDIDGTATGDCPCDGTGDGSDAGKHDYAEGTVTFTAGGTGGPGDFNWLVGNDRDDDGSTTTTDLDGSNDVNDEGTDPATACNDDATRVTDGCFDDEFISGTVVSGALPTTTPRFCFTRDRDHAGGDWDDILVHLGANVPGPTPWEGTLRVEMIVNSFVAFPTCVARSGHPNDANAQLGGNPSVTSGVTNGPPAGGCTANDDGACEGEDSPDTSSTGSINAKDAGAQQKCVGSWSHIGVRGSYTGGTSTTSVRFWAECDGVLVIDCTATPSTSMQCQDAFNTAPNGGLLGCYYSASGGATTSIEGECFDPLLPPGVVPEVFRNSPI